MSEITNLKRDIAVIEKAILQTLKSSPLAEAQFKTIVNNYKRKKAIKTSLSAISSGTDTPWYQSGFVKDLFNFGAQTAATHQLSIDEQKKLDLQLQALKERNISLDKQIALTDTINKAKGISGNIITQVMNSPLKMGAVAGLLYMFFKSRRKTRK